MDSLMPLKDSLITIKSALNLQPINDILSECYEYNTDLLYKRLQNWISLSLLHFNNVQIEQNVLERFNLLSLLIKQNQINDEDDTMLERSKQQICKLKLCSIVLSVYTYTGTFWEALLKRAFKHLKAKKDTEAELNKQEWAIKEAFNAEGLHESESYITALSLKVDRVMASAIYNILSAVDKYYNLHILQSKVCAISTLWITIFEEMEIILDATYRIDTTGSDHSNSAFASFKCHFPFFWIFINSIESQWKVSAVKSEYCHCYVIILKVLCRKL